MEAARLVAIELRRGDLSRLDVARRRKLARLLIGAGDEVRVVATPEATTWKVVAGVRGRRPLLEEQEGTPCVVELRAEGEGAVDLLECCTTRPVMMVSPVAVPLLWSEEVRHQFEVDCLERVFGRIEPGAWGRVQALDEQAMTFARGVLQAARRAHPVGSLFMLEEVLGVEGAETLRILEGAHLLAHSSVLRRCFTGCFVRAALCLFTREPGACAGGCVAELEGDVAREELAWQRRRLLERLLGEVF